MKQIVRRVIDPKGKVVVIDLPVPTVEADQVLVRNAYSLISSGTEMSTLKKTPAELVRQTLQDPWMRHVVEQTILSTGLQQTSGRIWQEMIMPREIGYSGSGVVLAVGKNVDGFRVGDTVAYAATGHAEVVAPTLNRIVPVPDGMDLRHAAFVTVGGIVIQSLRRAEIQFGETVAIYGLGLLGQLCALVAKAAGCVVVGIDINEARNQLARSNGADLVINPTQSDLTRRIMDYTDKHGVDVTVICASSKEDQIINSSMEITRKQGRVVIVGYVGLDIHPKNFLLKEIDLRYSRAYGPGRHHMAYEKGRVDYPFGYVRWTQQRNLKEFVRLVGTRAIDVESLIGNTYRVSEAQQAFDDIATGALRGVAALIDYEASGPGDLRRTLPVHPRLKKDGNVGIAVVGVGNHVLSKHLPHLKGMPGVEIRALVSATGKNAAMVAKSYDVTETSTDITSALKDPGTDAVMICTNQNKHLEPILQSIRAGKAVFVEKPTVTTLTDFAALAQVMNSEARPAVFTVGLNRRYSAFVNKLRSVVEGPIDHITYRIATPFLPPEHWTLDEVEGGGRLITEGEHFFDLCNLLIGRPALSVFAHPLRGKPDDLRKLTTWSATIHYEGAAANIIFDESGSPSYPREQLVVMASGQIAVLDDFARLTIFGKKRHVFGNGKHADKGHRRELQEFVAAIRGEPNELLTWEESCTASICMFAAQESIRHSEPVNLRDFQAGLNTTRQA
jgi:predicted dehydrogenase/threonine dehydrogenase-like Zn-dependent dehydrogenase